LSELQVDIGVSYRTVLRMRDMIKRATRKYRGYQTDFGAWPRSFMTRGDISRWSYQWTKRKLLAEGKHPSQHDIRITGVLSGSAPYSTAAAMRRTERLLRLLLATSKPTLRKSRAFGSSVR
jgi:hypothetical protein